MRLCITKLSAVCSEHLVLMVCLVIMYSGNCARFAQNFIFDDVSHYYVFSTWLGLGVVLYGYPMYVINNVYISHKLVVSLAFYI